MIKSRVRRLFLKITTFITIIILVFTYRHMREENLIFTRFILPNNYTYNSSFSGYLVSTPHCQIPDTDPYDKSIRPFLKEVTPILCSTKEPLTYIKPETNYNNIPMYSIVVNNSAVSDYVEKREELACCYSVITGGYDDNSYRISECSDFADQVLLNKEFEYVYVKCWKQLNLFYIKVYENMHAVVPVKEKARYKYNVNSQPFKEKVNKLSILLLGIDSMSRLNIMRTMPKTVLSLKRNGWVELQGYNKVGDNTLPNLLPILTGHTYKKIKEMCMTKFEQFDDCPFLWKKFSENDYVTLYVEDEPKIGTFHYEKPGFKKPPTDYYFRPYIIASQDELQLKTVHSQTICTGPSKTTDHILQYLYNFMQTFKNTPYFGVTWINHIGHNDHNLPALFDENFEKFFYDLQESSLLNSTILIFLSDHGIRFGEIRQTHVGWLEERLPFLYIWLPHWFRTTYSKEYHNLQHNSNKLVVPQDIYRMLRNILQKSQDETSTNVDNSYTCTSCIDLFSQIISDRSCDDADIPHHFCSCVQYEEIPSNTEVIQHIAQYIVNEIRGLLTKVNIKTTHTDMHCADIHLNNILSSRIQKIQDMNGNFRTDSIYVIVLETLPGNAMFEATVVHSILNEFKLLGVISRINAYNNQSECIEDHNLKLYCYCVYNN